MKKILFGITGLTIGGAERVLVDIANELSDEYEINIFTIYGHGEFENLLNGNIKITNLYPKSFNEYNKIKKTLISLKLLLFKKNIYKKYINGKYSTEIAFLEGPITNLFSNKNKNTKKIAWVHNDITQVFGKGIKAKIKNKLNKKNYFKYDEIIFVSNDNLEKFTNKYRDIKAKKHVIYNYLNIENIINKSNEEIKDFPKSECINFVTACRLVEQKAIDRLINVHYNLIKNGFYHKFYVVGDGPLKNELLKLIKNLNVDDTFILLGAKQNPYPYIKNADYFCLLSYYEGFPMVLLEAQALNKYILITDTAARETLTEYSYKNIFENNEKAIYEGLKNIIKENKTIEINYNYDNKEILNKIKEIIGE